MRRGFLPFVVLVAALQAAEPVVFPMELGTLKTLGPGSGTYEKVRIVGRDAVGIKITHEGGTSRIAYERLPVDLRRQFTVDPAAAKAQLRAEAEHDAAHDQAVKEGYERAEAEAEIKRIEEEWGTLDDEDEAFIKKMDEKKEPAIPGRNRAERILAMRSYVEELKKEVVEADYRWRRRMDYSSRRLFRTYDYGRVNSRQLLRYKGAEARAKRQEASEDYTERAHGRHKRILDEAVRKLNAAQNTLSDLEQAKDE